MGCAHDVGDQRHVLAGGQAGNQVVELENESDVMAPVFRERRLVGGRQIAIAIGHRAARRHIEAADDVEERRFAAAGRPEHDDELAGSDRQRHAAQRMHVDLAHPVDLGDIPQGKDGVRHADIMRAAYRREGQPFPEKAALPAGSYLCLGLAELLGASRPDEFRCPSTRCDGVDDRPPAYAA